MTAVATASPSELVRDSGLIIPRQFKSPVVGPVRSSWLDGEPAGPNAFRQVTGLFQSYQGLGYMLPWEALDYIELLATYNPDYSQAVENIKMLANSGHTLVVQASSKLATRRIKSRLEEKARTIQASSGGMDGVIDKLMDQAATYGAMCGEWILNEDLTDVVDFVDLNPKRIRFFWEDEEQAFMPYQKVNGAQAKVSEEAGQIVVHSCVKLNPLTFRYFDFDAAPESPYGTPPFLAALANIAIQRDMISNMAQIIKKIGLLGIVDLEIERLDPMPGETPEQYQSRAQTHLAAYQEVAEMMVQEGGLIHFDDVTAKTYNIGGNAAGATNLHKANEEMVFSGLKSMPSVQGRSYSTTETYAGVAYDIILRNTRKYQRAAKRMIESGYWLMAFMWGENPDSIKLIFNENRSLNRMQEAQAERFELENSFLMWAMGLLDQDDVGQRSGVSEPKHRMSHPPEELYGVIGAAAQPDPEPAKTSSSDSVDVAESVKEYVQQTVQAETQQLELSFATSQASHDGGTP